MARPKTRRRIKLILPGLQLRLMLSSLGVCALGLLFECLLFSLCLAEIAVDLPEDGAVLLESVRPMLLRVTLISAAGILPLIFVVGVLSSFRVAGPLYRFEVYLKQVARGERPPDCRLRKGDELHGLCELINVATAPLRAAPSPGEARPEEGRPSLPEAA